MEDHESSSRHVIERVLPDGWVKRITQRRSGISKGGLDVYLLPPPGHRQRRLRSTVELMRFIRDYPHVPLDPVYVNFGRSFEPADEGSILNLLHAVKLMKNWKTGDPKPSDSLLMIGGKKRKKTPVHVKVKKSQLSKSKIKYLNCQYAKVRYPSSDQIMKMAEGLTADPQVVYRWFVGRVGIDVKRSRPVRFFDITDIGMPNPDCHRDMEQFDEEYIIEQGDAEADI